MMLLETEVPKESQAGSKLGLPPCVQQMLEANRNDCVTKYNK